MNEARVTVDFGRRLGPLRPIWRSIGYDEINWTYTPGAERCTRPSERSFVVRWR